MELGLADLFYELVNLPDSLADRILSVFGGVGERFFYHASMAKTGAQFNVDGRTLQPGKDFIIYREDVLIFKEALKDEY